MYDFNPNMRNLPSRPSRTYAARTWRLWSKIKFMVMNTAHIAMPLVAEPTPVRKHQHNGTGPDAVEAAQLTVMTIKQRLGPATLCGRGHTVVVGEDRQVVRRSRWGGSYCVAQVGEWFVSGLCIW
jgi:hypothetical protein